MLSFLQIYVSWESVESYITYINYVQPYKEAYENFDTPDIVVVDNIYTPIHPKYVLEYRLFQIILGSSSTLDDNCTFQYKLSTSR